MATLSVTRNYDDGQILTEAQLDSAFDSIETFTNTTKLNADNLQDGAVTTAKIDSAAVTAAKLATSAVETAKINDLAVTTAKINDLAVTTAKINDLAVTTAKIAAANVTRAKLEAVGQQISSASGSFTTSSTSFTDVTNLSVNITTTGRPVFISLIPDSASNFSYVGQAASSGATAAGWDLAFLKDSTVIATSRSVLSFSAATTPNLQLPPGAYFTLDIPSAGTYAYKVQVKRIFGDNTVDVTNVKLLVYEL